MSVIFLSSNLWEPGFSYFDFFVPLIIYERIPMISYDLYNKLGNLQAQFSNTFFEFCGRRLFTIDNDNERDRTKKRSGWEFDV